MAYKKVKRTFRDAKIKVSGNLYIRLDGKDGEKIFTNLLNEKKVKKRLYLAKWIKSEDLRVLVKDEENKERWKKLFSEIDKMKNI